MGRGAKGIQPEEDEPHVLSRAVVEIVGDPLQEEFVRLRLARGCLTDALSEGGVLARQAFEPAVLAADGAAGASYHADEQEVHHSRGTADDEPALAL